LRKRHGVRFVLAVAFFILVSGGWLILQLAGISSSAGSATALESPPALTTLTLPPGIPLESIPAVLPTKTAPPVVSAPPLTEEAVPEEASDESPAPDAPPTLTLPNQDMAPQTSAAEPVPAPAKASSASPAAPKVPESKPVSAKPVAPKPAETKPTAPKAPPKEELKPVQQKQAVVPPPAIAASAPTSLEKEKHEIVKRASRPRKSRAKKNVVETTLPPEWDWFNVPLKIKHTPEKMAIYTDYEETRQPIFAAKMVQAPPKTVLQPLPPPPVVFVPEIDPSLEHAEAIEDPALTIDQDDGRPMPFEYALARLEKRRSMRERDAQERSLVLPSQGDSKGSRYVPSSLLRLQDTLRRFANPSANDHSASVSGVESLGQSPEAFIPHLLDQTSEAEPASEKASETVIEQNQGGIKLHQFPLISGEGFRVID
jgi:hypothetical protein